MRQRHYCWDRVGIGTLYLAWSLLPHFYLYVHAHEEGQRSHFHAVLSPDGHPEDHQRPHQDSLEHDHDEELFASSGRPSATIHAASNDDGDRHAHYEEEHNVPVLEVGNGAGAWTVSAPQRFPAYLSDPFSLQLTQQSRAPPVTHLV